MYNSATKGHNIAEVGLKITEMQEKRIAKNFF